MAEAVDILHVPALLRRHGFAVSAAQRVRERILRIERIRPVGFGILEIRRIGFVDRFGQRQCPRRRDHGHFGAVPAASAVIAQECVHAVQRSAHAAAANADCTAFFYNAVSAVRQIGQIVPIKPRRTDGKIRVRRVVRQKRLRAGDAVQITLQRFGRVPLLRRAGVGNGNAVRRVRRKRPHRQQRADKQHNQQTANGFSHAFLPIRFYNSANHAQPFVRRPRYVNANSTAVTAALAAR